MKKDETTDHLTYTFLGWQATFSEHTIILAAKSDSQQCLNYFSGHFFNFP